MPDLIQENGNQQSADKNDELVGTWENDLDDGSGLHAIWGWSFEFKEDGTGIHSHWSASKLDDQVPFSWQRLTENSFRIKFGEDDGWAVIQYSTEVVAAPYAGKLLKLTDNNFKKDDTFNEGFWDCPGAIFKYI